MQRFFTKPEIILTLRSWKGSVLERDFNLYVKEQMNLIKNVYIEEFCSLTKLTKYALIYGYLFSNEKDHEYIHFTKDLLLNWHTHL